MEVINVSGRNFRVPIIQEQKKEDAKKKPTPGAKFETKWLEKTEERMECKIGKIEGSESESDDDDLYQYWVKDEENQASQVPQLAKPPSDESAPPELFLMPAKSEIQEKLVENPLKQYSHTIHIPLFDNPQMKKRFDLFRNKIVDKNPVFQGSLVQRKICLPILYMTLDADQMETLEQIFKLEGVFPKEKKKPRIEVQGLGFECHDNSKDPKRANLLFSAIRKTQDVDKMEAMLNDVVCKMIEFGALNENNLANIRYDISASMYKVDHWRVSILDGKTVDMSEVFSNGELKDFVFGNYDFSQITLSRNNDDLTEIASIKF